MSTACWSPFALFRVAMWIAPLQRATERIADAAYASVSLIASSACIKICAATETGNQ
jgi:hypothetical protein